jgi:hypothetical protein
VEVERNEAKNKLPNFLTPKRRFTMMKRFFSCVVLSGTMVAAGFAQSPDNVEKAVRFRAPQAEKAVTTGSVTPISSDEKQIELKAKPAQHNSEAQLQELGGVPFDSNAPQLEELGPRWKWWPNAEQLDELGPRWKWWPNANQLDELGPRWKWWPNAEQLDDQK